MEHKRAVPSQNIEESKKRLVSRFRMNKEMIELRANQGDNNAAGKEDDVLHSIFGLMCSNSYDRNNPAKLAQNFQDLGVKASELGALRLKGLDSYDLLDERSRESGLGGLIIGYESDSPPMHAQRERPYLFAPIRALAALETLLEIWGDNGLGFWSPGVDYTVDYLGYLGIGDNPDRKLAALSAWMKSQEPRLEAAAKGIFFLDCADDFEAAALRTFQTNEPALKEMLWFLDGDRYARARGILNGLSAAILRNEAVPSGGSQGP